MHLSPVPLKRSASGNDVDEVRNTSLGDLIRSAFPGQGMSIFSRTPTSLLSSPNSRRRFIQSPVSPLRTITTPRASKEFGVLSIPRRSRSTSPRPNPEPEPELPPLVSRSMSAIEELSPTVRPSHVKSRQHTRGRSAGSLDANIDMPILSKSTSSTLRPSQVRARSRSSGRSSGYNFTSTPATQLRYVFDAPAQGRLGLTLESSKKGPGCRIHAVKDYSPVYGLVNCQDRVVAIDNVDTTQMDSQQVSKILKARQHIKKGTIRLAVARSVDRSSVPTLPSDSTPLTSPKVIEVGGSLTPRAVVSAKDVNSDDWPFLLANLSLSEESADVSDLY